MGDIENGNFDPKKEEDLTVYDQGGERRWWRKKPYAIGSAAVLLAAGFGIGFGVRRWMSETKNLAVGIVSCKADQTVEGVLVDGYGWADITPQGGYANTVTFRKKISGNNYKIEVGCDGKDTHHWAITDQSNSLEVVNSPKAFLCDPSPSPSPTTPQRKGICLAEVPAIPQN